MAERRVHLPYILDHQGPVLASASRNKVVVCGRRWGKTVLGLIAVILGHGPNMKFRGALRGGQIRWIAPTYPIATSIWKSLKASLWEAWTTKDEVGRTINLPGGGSVAVRSADDPDSLRGVGSDGVVIDEAAFCKREAWEEAIRPSLADRQGWALFISTPCGFNWFHDLFQFAESGASGWECWQRPTADNPKIPPEEIADARRSMAEFRFRQEFLAEFVSPGIGFFKRGNWEYVDVLPRGLAAIARGWDFASTKVDEKKKNDPDWTAGALVARGHDDRWYIADVRRMRGTPKERRDFIRSTAEADGRGVQIGIPQDPGSAGIDVSDEYVIEVLPGFRVVVRRETGSKILRAEPLAAQAQAKNVSLLRGPWVPEWLNESDMFPNGIHDDQVDATSLAFSILSAGVGGLVAAPGYGPIQNQTEKRDLAGFVPERAENPFRSAREPGAWGDEGRRR